MCMCKYNILSRAREKVNSQHDTMSSAAAADNCCFYCKTPSEDAATFAKLAQLGVADNVCQACADTKPIFQHSTGVIFTLQKLTPHWSRCYQINPASIIIPPNAQQPTQPTRSSVEECD